jgi:hypothetical protein
MLLFQLKLQAESQRRDFIYQGFAVVDDSLFMATVLKAILLQYNINDNKLSNEFM